MSEHTIHSSSVSLSWVGDALDGVIQGSLQQKENKIQCVKNFKVQKNLGSRMFLAVKQKILIWFSNGQNDVVKTTKCKNVQNSSHLLFNYLSLFFMQSAHTWKTGEHHRVNEIHAFWSLCTAR